MSGFLKAPQRVGDIRPTLPPLGKLMARAAQGVALNIGCIGDSTTDGAGTTGTIDNPTAGVHPQRGKIPAATTNHTDESPNSFPAVLRQMLRDRNNNALVNVWNGGYGGQMLREGWATDWYDTIFAGNPNYGSPDMVLIGFGLNDANTAMAGMVADYLKGLRSLCVLIRTRGAVPVVLTPDAVVNPAYVQRQRKELAIAVRAWCKAEGVDCIDVTTEAERYWAINGRVKKAVEIADFVHPGDNYHGFKAGLLLRDLCGNIPLIAGAQYAIGFSDVAAGATLMPPSKDTASDLRFGASTATGGYASALTVIDAFVWSDADDYKFVLRVASPVVSSAPVPISAAPAITVQGADKYRQAASIYYAGTLWLGDRTQPILGFCDMPAEICHLRYGLNRIQVVIPVNSAVNYVFDSLEFLKTGLPRRAYQTKLAALQADRRSCSGVGSVSATVHLELPRESHLFNQSTMLSFSTKGDVIDCAVEFQGAVNTGVNLFTAVAGDGTRLTFGLVKTATALNLCHTNTSWAVSDVITGVAIGTAPEILRCRAVFENGADNQPEIRLYYAGALWYTLKLLGGFALPTAGHIGGAYSLNAATVDDDVRYSVSMRVTRA